MEGARKYVTAIRALAKEGGYGFEKFENSSVFYKNGSFLFELSEHARGKTMRVLLLKKMPPINIERSELLKYARVSENSLEVYGIISGKYGWNETYGYLVNNEIKQVLSSMLIEAMYNFNTLKTAKEFEKASALEAMRFAHDEKVKDFEKFLLNGCKEDVPTPIKTELQLNRAWIYEEGNDEPIGEKNFVIPADYFSSIFPTLFREVSDKSSFLDVYEPEFDGEAIYQKALIDGKIIEEFDTIYKSEDKTNPCSSNPIEVAYKLLLKVQNNPNADINDFSIAVEEAIGYLGQALDESDTEDENIITLEMIKEGLKQGLIVPKVEGDGLKCYIGEYFFYFGGSEYENTDPKDIPEDVLSMEIKTVLDAFNESTSLDFERERMYCYYYLLENLKEKSDAE